MNNRRNHPPGSIPCASWVISDFMWIPDVTVVFPTQACQGHVIVGIEAKKMTFSHD